MKKLTDQNKRRREYLRKRYVPLLLVLFGILWYLIWFIGLSRFGPTALSFRIFLGIFYVIVIVVQLPKAVKVVKTARQVPYVPPVSVDNLPAKEVLVRGADEPPVMQSEVLLRAVTHKEVPKEELLRSTEE